MMRNAYRLQRLQHRTFKHLHSIHSLAHLKSTISPHYQSFVDTIDLSLRAHGVEADFDAVRWSDHPLDKETQTLLRTWTRGKKASKPPQIVDLLVFRAAKERAPYESNHNGLVFAGIQDGALSPENIRDIALYIRSLDIEDPPRPVEVNGEDGTKRSVSMPGFTQSWDSVVQTSSSLISALSFGTVPAKRSPLAASEDDPAPPKLGAKADVVKGRWIVGGNTGAKRIWLEEGEERAVPISLGNARPGFLHESFGQQTPGKDNLVELDLSVYKFDEYLFTFLTIPEVKPPEPPESTLDFLISPPLPTRPTTPLTLNPFIILHDPITHRLHSTLPAIPPLPLITASSNPFTFSPSKRPQKRDPWPRDTALEIHTHILHLRDQYPQGSSSRHKRGFAHRVREFTVKTPNFFIFRTVVPSDDRRVTQFAEGWYIVKIGGRDGGLGRGDDAGGLEDIARAGREKVREVWKGLNEDTLESDDEL